MAKKIEKAKCDHCWLPELFSYDSQVFGVEDEEDVFLQSDLIIVRCSECGKYGYILAERIN